IGHLKHAVELQDKQIYMEPPEWHYPIREALGGALLRTNDAAAAEAVFRKDLHKNPRNGRSLFGLLKSLEMQGKDVGTEWVKREFEKSWTGTPMTLQVDLL
ncbi:MAG TPA: hypothetical protein VEQ63_14335, partial [Bryobacteraceae bacterium]|nr:hypothetical protein [Bryobacteraceae bacterium]